MRTVTFTLLAAVLDCGALAAQRHNDPNILTAAEIARSNVTTAYEAVETLRPRWLQSPRGFSHVPSEVPGPLTGGMGHEYTGQRPTRANETTRTPATSVYLNDASVGDLDYLKTVPARAVLEMRWLNPFDAANRFGPTDGQAAIVLTLQPSGGVNPPPP